eukprot:15436810-Alexandrium_andersonii.AAC.1
MLAAPPLLAVSRGGCQTSKVALELESARLAPGGPRGQSPEGQHPSGSIARSSARQARLEQLHAV